MSDSSDYSQPKNPNFLVKQLERARLERALEIAREMADVHKFLNSAELARLNSILNGKQPGNEAEAWRDGAAVCSLKTGSQATFQMLSDPVKRARELLFRAKERAASGDVIEAAADLYADLVMNHVFKDANRRTAVVAACYLLELYGYEVSASGVHDLGLGDLRVAGQREALADLFRNIVKIVPLKKT